MSDLTIGVWVQDYLEMVAVAGKLPFIIIQTAQCHMKTKGVLIKLF